MSALEALAKALYSQEFDHPADETDATYEFWRCAAKDVATALADAGYVIVFGKS